MSDFPRWKYVLVALAMLFGVIYALPNAFPPVPAVQVSANRDAPPVDQALRQKVIEALQKQKIAYGEVAVHGDNLLATFANTDVQKSGSDAIKALLGDNYTVAFKLQSTVPAWLGAIGARSMPLGLDLQGGVHFLMQVDQNDVIDKQESSYADDIRSLLRDNKIRYESVTRNPVRGKGVAVVLRSAEDRSRASDLIANEYTDLLVSNGPSTGDRFVLNAVIKPDKLRDITRGAITQNLQTLRNRINALGVSEPLIQQQGENHIVVDLAGVQDPTEAKKLIGTVATLEYRPGIGYPGDPQAVEAEKTGNIPPDANLYHMRGSNLPVLVSKKVIVTGKDLVDASSGIDQQSGTPKVDVTLNDAGIASPFGRQFQTTGLGSPKEASDLALLLKGGAFAAPVDIIEEGVIGSSLGADNIDKGFKSVMLGLALVLLAAAIYYKLFGLVADIALFFNLVILVAVMSLIGVTLTMPGIAGIVLTLGMAIDANVLICERVREELRNGSTPHASIRAGYEKAWSTILDANVTHLIAALALTTMGTGAIKGFGVTLMIGILTSLFTSVTLTHAFTAAIHGHRKLKTLSV